MNPLEQPMLARRQLRLAIMSALKPLQQTLGATLASPGTWPTPKEKLPALLVNAPTEQKQPIGKGMANFETSISVVIQGQVSDGTPEKTQDLIDELAYQVENAVLKDYWVTKMIQRFASVQTETEITAEAGPHLAGFRMTLVGEVFESFDPTLDEPAESPWPPASPVIAPLTSMGIHLDTASPFDATGTYPDPAFPDAVQPAPRTTGPDGRDEGALDIQLPQ